MVTSVAIIIDNSDTAADGDYKPNRLIAQTMCINQLVQVFLKSDRSSEFCITTMGESEFGIRSSFTSNYSKIVESTSNIKCGGKSLLKKAMKTQLIALRHSTSKTAKKRVIAFVMSRHDIRTSHDVNDLLSAFRRERAALDVVAFGDGVDGVDLLREMCSKIEDSNFLEVRECKTRLSDYVLQSKIRPEGGAKTSDSDVDLFYLKRMK